MSMENPFARKPTKQEEVDTSYVDLAEGKLGAQTNQEVSPAQIESAETDLSASVARLKETMGKSVDEKKLEEPDTWEKIQKSWSNAKLRATEAFTVLLGAELGAFIWLGETAKTAQEATGTFGTDYAELLQRVEQLQTGNMALIAASLAVPAVMLGMSKLSKMRREKNLNT